MLRNFLILLSVTIVFLLAVRMMLGERRDAAQPVTVSVPAPRFDLEPIVPPPVAPGDNLVGDVSVHSVEALETLLGRVEELLERPRAAGEAPLITLVLHGPEVEFFALRNYSTYKDVVDHAAKLAALGAVDLAICQTQMRNRGIASNDVPTFLRQIPFGPDEVERLVGQGYVYM